MSKGMLAVLLALLLVIVASGMLVSAADAAVPGDWMYGLDRAMDSLRLRMALDHKQKAQVARQLARERLREAQTLVRRGETVTVELLLQESHHAMLAAKAADPNAARKTEKPVGILAIKTATATQVEQHEPQSGRARHLKNSDYCNGTVETNHPEGEKLADEFGVGYDEIIGWFCKGYGFGEIGLAYKISGQRGVPAVEIFNQRAGGMSWGKIKQFSGQVGKSTLPE